MKTAPLFVKALEAEDVHCTFGVPGEKNLDLAATRLKLDLVILLPRNDACGMIRWKQSRIGYADYGMRFGNPVFALLAEPTARMGAARPAPTGSCRPCRAPMHKAACTRSIWPSTIPTITASSTNRSTR